jgi:hypothetical protein
MRVVLKIHYTRIYQCLLAVEGDGCIDAIFTDSVVRLERAPSSDITIVHGDGITEAAKKGGDNIGLSGHKKVKGDKVVAFYEFP